MKFPAGRKLFALTGAFAVALPLNLTAVGASAQPIELIPGLTDSALLQGEVIASGTLFTADGVLAPEGTVVRANAWPSVETLGALNVGESVKITPVAFGTTARDGSFTLRYSDPRLLEPYVSKKTGLVDLEVTAVVEGTPAVYNISRAPGSASLVSATARTAIDMAPIELKPIPESQSAAPLVDSDGRPSVHNKACTGTKLQDYTVWVNVGQGYSSSSTTMSFTYSNGSSSSLGVGLSSTGNYGTYSASGTASVSASGSVGYPAVTGTVSRLWDTQFRYTKFRYYCYEQSPSTTYQVRPTAWVGGARTTDLLSTAPAANYCATFGAGSSFTKNTSAATTYSGGAQTSGAIGVNLSAQTGYTNAASIKFNFGISRRLCGTSGFPGATPGRLVAKA